MDNPALTDCQILCLRYLQLHELFAHSDESWPELDGLVERGLLKVNRPTEDYRIYDVTVAGMAAARAAFKQKGETANAR